MADKQISDLTSASAMTDSSLFVIEQGGAAKSANWGMIKSYISPGVAAQYSSSATYNVGNYVIYNEQLYRCTTAITTPESWTAEHWMAVTLCDDMDDISQPSRNIWPFNSSVTFTRYTVLSNDGVLLPAGTYSVSAVVSSVGGTGTAARILFRNSSNGDIIDYTITKNTNSRNGVTATLTEDCYYILLFSDANTSASTGINATWKDIQIESGDTQTEYVPHLSARDTVNEQAIVNLRGYVDNKIYGDAHLLPSAVGIESLDFLTIGENLFNYDDEKNVSGYLLDNGGITESTTYKTSWFIKVKPSTTYYVGGLYVGSSYKNVAYLCEYDDALNVIQYYSGISESFITQSTAKYIRFTYRSTLASSKVYFGETNWDGITAPAYSAKLPNEYLNIASDLQTIDSRLDNLENAIDLSIYEKHYEISGNLTDGAYLKDESMSNSIRSNERLMFNADITSFNSIEIGFAWFSTSYKYNRFIIDSTNLTIYDYNGNTETVAHGLTITNNIQVLIESNFMRTCDITIISNGYIYKAEGKALDRRRVAFPYAQSVGSVLPNAKLSWTCIDFDKPIWIFGDSYVASWSDKWVKYFYEYGYADNCLFDAFPGESSSQSLESLQHLLNIARPKTIVWCLGMNDGGDSSTAPSADWTSAQGTLRTICQTNNIQLILATVPTVPTINHEQKNANVRASGYRYIDFAKAVGANSSGQWFGYGTNHDMLSSDGVHPSDYGAKALFGRVVLDVPEVMIAP